MGNYWISKDCCHFERLPTVYFTVLTIQAIAIMQATAFLLFSYLRDVEIYSTIYDNLKYALHFDCFIPFIIIQLSWFISAIATVYSVQKIIPYLMLPHLFISLFLLFVTVLFIILTAYHIITEALVDEALSISNSISYSRRPTVIISDDYLHMLHR
ncbi:hypothetical protein WUBG_08944 [Wuchereria bancrofti]|uniref:Uncharacterized protein n=1 Tax=Wuchereria bancrofti TaxID=6293 RepID=J9EST1_WUCBA|nr:hypothetical protein WUBG_08944 [Wuchereria bancrofti]